METTENILDVTRIDDRTLHLRKEPLCVDDLIANTMEDIRNQLDPQTENNFNTWKP